MRGVLVERWERGCAAQIGYLFGLSCLPVAPLYLKIIGLDIGRVIAKCLFSMNFSFGLPIGCQKALTHLNLRG